MPRRNDQNDALGVQELQPLEKYDERNAKHEKHSLTPYHLRAATCRPANLAYLQIKQRSVGNLKITKYLESHNPPALFNLTAYRVAT